MRVVFDLQGDLPQKQPWEVLEVEFSPDSRSLAVANGDGSVWLWELATRQGRPLIEARPLNQTGPWVQGVRFSPNGRWLALGSDKGLTLWETTSWQPVLSLDLSVMAHGISFTSDSALMAVGVGGGETRIFNPETGELLRKLTGQRGKVDDMIFSADGKLLAMAGPADEGSGAPAAAEDTLVGQKGEDKPAWDARIGIWETSSWTLV